MVSEIKLDQPQNPTSRDRGKRIHPHKFTLWVAIGSIVMMFAGLTSAYIVKSSQAGWQKVKTPQVFFFSTGVILLSSLTIQMALRSFKQREMNRYRRLMLLTLLLGGLFVFLQWSGFLQLWNSGVQFRGVAGAGQFLYVIFGLHALHVAGGVIALIVMAARAFFGPTKFYGSTGMEVMATYWHFVDLLWLYLLVFFIWLK
jgi:cytochrome c oxidase subunit 3